MDAFLVCFLKSLCLIKKSSIEVALHQLFSNLVTALCTTSTCLYIDNLIINDELFPEFTKYYLSYSIVVLYYNDHES